MAVQYRDVAFKQTAWTRYLFAILLTVIFAALRLALNPFLLNTGPYILFLLSVILSGLYGGLGPALLATFLSAIFGYSFVTQSEQAVAIPVMAEVLLLGIFIVEAIALCLVSHLLHLQRRKRERLHSQVSLALRREQETSQALEKSNVAFKQAEESLRRSEDRFHLLMENITDYGIFTMDTTGVILDWNIGAERITGFTGEEVIGKRFHFLFIEEDQKGGVPNQELSMAAKDGRAPDVRWHCRKDGSLFWGEGFTTALFDEGGHLKGFSKLFHDATQRKRAEEAMAKAKQAAEDANRAKSNFLANMSHEIRTPLGAIIGFSALLKQPDLKAEDRQRFVETVERNAAKLGQLIDDILDLSKVEAGHLELEKMRFSLPEVIEDVLESLSIKAAKRGIQLHFKSDGKVPEVIMNDPNRLRQVLLNIVGNAIKFTERGQVSVTLRMLSPEKPEDEARIEFVVTDTGRGISEEQRAQLFQPFTQADDSTARKFGGTGLGLVLARRLARLMGGDVRLEQSALGKGSTFVIIISAGKLHELGSFTELKDSEEKPAHIETSPAKLAGINVLIVDDNPDNQELVKQLLTSNGARVGVAENGVEAIHSALSHPYDVVLMDIQMPEMDGYQATGELRRRGYKKPIVALTAHAMKDEVEKTLKAGCDDHLSKPIQIPELLDTVLAFGRHTGRGT